MKDRAAAIRRETLLDLDGWLDRLERALAHSSGGDGPPGATPAEARRIVLDLARDAGRARGEEQVDGDRGDRPGAALEAVGIEVVETDLGEYIVQVAGERPSHMITPAIHKTSTRSRPCSGPAPMVRCPSNGRRSRRGRTTTSG